MKVFIEKENKTVEMNLSEKRKIIDILNELNIILDSVILVKNNQIALEDSLISNDDELKILSVVSGG